MREQGCSNETAWENEIARLQGLDAIREDVANLLQEEIAQLTRKLAVKGRGGKRATGSAGRKSSSARRCIPTISEGNEAQQRMRGDIFREIWPQIELIERG